MDYIKDAIKKLVEEAKKNPNGDNVMRTTQAALNLAHIYATLTHSDKHNT